MAYKSEFFKNKKNETAVGASGLTAGTTNASRTTTDNWENISTSKKNGVVSIEERDAAVRKAYQDRTESGTTYQKPTSISQRLSGLTADDQRSEQQAARKYRTMEDLTTSAADIRANAGSTSDNVNDLLLQAAAQKAEADRLRSSLVRNGYIQKTDTSGVEVENWNDTFSEQRAEQNYSRMQTLRDSVGKLSDEAVAFARSGNTTEAERLNAQSAQASAQAQRIEDRLTAQGYPVRDKLWGDTTAGDLGSAFGDSGYHSGLSGLEQMGSYLEQALSIDIGRATEHIGNVMKIPSLQYYGKQFQDIDSSDSVLASAAKDDRAIAADTMEKSSEGAGAVDKFLLDQAAAMGNMAFTAGMAGASGLSGLASAGTKVATKLGKNAALGTLGVSAAGNSAMEALDNGATDGQALAYGLVAGSLEVLSEKLFDGNPVLDQDSGLVKKLLYQITGNKQLMGLLDNKAADILNEGLEEVVTELLDPLAEYLIYNKDNVQWADADSVANAFLGGVFMSLTMNGADYAVKGLTNGGNGADPVATTLSQPADARSPQGARQGAAADEVTDRAASFPYDAQQTDVLDAGTQTAEIPELLQAAVDMVSGGGKVSNSAAERILSDPEAMQTLSEDAGLGVSASMTKSEQRSAVKTAVEALARSENVEKDATEENDAPVSETAQSEPETAVQLQPAQQTDSQSSVQTQPYVSAQDTVQTQQPGTDTALAQAKAATVRNVVQNGSAFGENGKRAFQTTIGADADPVRYYQDFAAYYNAGLSGKKMNAVNSGGVMSASQQYAAYSAGQNDAKVSLKADQNAAKFATVYGKESGLIADDYTASQDSETMRQINEVSKMLGIRTQFVDAVAGGKANASIQDGVVLIERGNENPVRTLFGHEITHRMQELAPNSYRAFRTAAMAEYGSDAEVAVKNELYGDTNENAMDEIAADYAGRLIEEQDLLERFISKNKGNRSLLQRVLDAFRDLVSKLTGSHKKQAQDAVTLLEKAMNDSTKRAGKLQGGHRNATMKATKYSEKERVDHGTEGKPESRREFLERVHRSAQRSGEIGDVAYAYTQVGPLDTSRTAEEISTELTRIGIDNVFHSGLEINENGMTYSDKGEASSIGGAFVAIYNKSFGDGKWIAGHEAFHMLENSNGRGLYVSICRENLEPNSPYGIEQAGIIYDTYIGDGEYDKAYFMDEFLAHISGLIHSGKYDEQLRTMFRDYDAVKSAWEQLVGSQRKTKGSSYIVDTTFNETADRNATQNNGNYSATDKRIKYSLKKDGGGERYSLKDNADDKRYSYDSLISKPDMTVTVIPDNIPIPTKGKKVDISTISKSALNGFQINSSPDSTQRYVHNSDLGINILVNRAGLQHGINGNKTNSSAINTAEITPFLPSIIRDSIAINQLRSRGEQDGDYSNILLGVGAKKDGTMYVVKTTVNHFPNNKSVTDNIEIYDVLKGSKAKKTEDRTSGSHDPNPESASPHNDASSKISVAEFLDIVKEKYPNLLPTNVLEHFGIDTGVREEGLKYSMKGSEELHDRIVELERQARSTNMSAKDMQSAMHEIVDNVYSKTLEQYGAIKPGERAAREVEVPKKLREGEKISMGSRTVMEAKATPDERMDDLKKAVLDGRFSYVPIHNKAAYSSAEARVEKNGWQTELTDWTAKVRRGESGADLVAEGAVLLNNAGNSDMSGKQYVDLVADYVRLARNAGQSLQAQRILKRLSPEGRLYMAQRSVDSLVDQLGGDYDISIDPALVEEYKKATSDAERDGVMDKITQDIADQIPTTLSDRFTALRYLNMLGNLKTQVRNVVGNLGMQPVRIAKDKVAAGIESIASAVSGGRVKRSKSFVSSPTLFKDAWNDFDNVRSAAMGERKYQDSSVDMSSEIQDKRTIFKAGEHWIKSDNAFLNGLRGVKDVGWKALEAYRKATNWAMDKGDSGFSRFTYADALAGYLASNDRTLITADEDMLDAARAYAIQQAQEATYRDNNAFSNAISKMRFKNPKNLVEKAMNVVGQGLMPFRKTPASILVRAEEYSPLGMINTAYQSVKAAKGQATAADIIDSIAKTITGTGLCVLGYALASQGLIHGGDDDDDKQADFDDLLGHQTYALELPDGTSVTLDWLAPECMPFFVGAQVSQAIADGGMSFKDGLAAVSSITDPMLQMSMLQGVNDALDNLSTYGSGDSALAKFVINELWSYLTQGTTSTLLGQIERSGEDSRMMTYVDKNSEVPDTIQRMIGKASAKIPGVDYDQIPYIDAWGRTQDYGGTAENTAYQTLSPAYVSNVQASEMENELQRLYEETGEEVYPSSAPKYFNVDKERKDLTAEEYTKYATVRGQTAYQILTDLTGSEIYQSFEDSDKCKAVSGVYEYANAIAKTEVSDYEIDGWVAKAQATVQSTGISPDQYIAFYTIKSNAAALKDKKTGDSITNSDSLAIMQAVYSVSGLTDKQRQQLFDDFDVGKKVRNYNRRLVDQKLAEMKRAAK